MARKVTEPSFKFWFEDKWYTAQGAQTMARIGTKDDIATMLAEYTRMRDTAQKRVKRLLEEYPEAKASQHKYFTGKVDAEGKPIYKYGFPTLASLDPRDFPAAFSELAKFLKAKTSTVTGQRIAQAKTTATLNKAIGADETEDDEDSGPQAKVTKQNYWRVIKILNEARKQKITYDSNKIVELADTTLELSAEQFDTVLDNLEKILVNSGTFADTLDDYMRKNKIQSYQMVNMDKFLENVGWK